MSEVLQPETEVLSVSGETNKMTIRGKTSSFAHSPQLVRIGVAFALAACTALADINTCPNGTTTAAVSNGSATPTVPIVADSPSGGNFMGVGAGGCTDVGLEV